MSEIYIVCVAPDPAGAQLSSIGCNTHDVYFAHLLRKIDPRISLTSLPDPWRDLVSGFWFPVGSVPEPDPFRDLEHFRRKTRNQKPDPFRDQGGRDWGNAWVDLA